MNKIREDEKLKKSSSVMADKPDKIMKEEEEDIYNKERYIAMERLRPVESKNYIISSKYHSNLIKSPDLKKISITNELGVFGVLVRDEQNVYINETCGYCLRSKPSKDNECGVMCGSGALDSIYFCD